MTASDELQRKFREFMLGEENTETAKARDLREHDLGTQKDELRDGNVRVFGQTAAGRHHARGVPLLPVSGTQPDTDPYQALLHKEAGSRDRFGDKPPREEQQ